MAEDRFPVVGVGACVGALDALKQFFGSMAPAPGMAFVVIMQDGADNQGALPQVLEGMTPLPVVVASDGQTLETNHIYLPMPDGVTTVRGGRFQVQLTSPPVAGNNLDVFLESLAEDARDRAFGVILTGVGEGSGGARAIRENGGLLIGGQTGAGGTEERKGLPSVTLSGSVDLQLPVEEMAHRLTNMPGGLPSASAAPAASGSHRRACGTSPRPNSSRNSVRRTPW